MYFEILKFSWLFRKHEFKTGLYEGIAWMGLNQAKEWMNKEPIL
jgi:hypothetical protein